MKSWWAITAGGDGRCALLRFDTREELQNKRLDFAYSGSASRWKTATTRKATEAEAVEAARLLGFADLPVVEATP